MNTQAKRISLICYLTLVQRVPELVEGEVLISAVAAVVDQ
tara:strand:+ start:265 stop:384 length:120 start_codon:yes stop_codon:yes gene_type:complete